MPTLGPKALHLQTLKQAGFPVPDFVAIDSVQIAGQSAKEIAGSVRTVLTATRFAVRSAALAEDTAASSMAGQFHTELDIPTERLAQAIETVLDDARAKLGSLGRFSLIVQDYVDADFAGVTFTRDPNGGRKTVIEYRQGAGEALVAGEIKPEHADWYRTEKPEHAALPAFAEACTLFLEIEDLFEAPQDIEWCVKDGNWFIVQSRPITTRNNRDDQAAAYLDEVLPTGIPFLWDQTEISEIAPRPNALTLTVLKKIYGLGGPVQNVYASIGITFIPRDFLRIVGDQLFVDREDELKTLLPAYSLLTKKTPYEPVPVSGKGAWISMVNLWKLKRWNMPPTDELLHRLVECEACVLPANAEESLAAFMNDYELIFLINLCAQRELAGHGTLRTHQIAETRSPDLIGNSLDFDDTSPFHGHGLEQPPVPLSYEWLREAARYLTVKHVDHIRRLAPKIQFSNESDFTFHGPLTNLPAKNSLKSNQGISPGTASGVLRRKEELVEGEGAILYTELLTPDLAPLLPHLKGIVSQQGGSLSHLAILAREHRIPAVVLGGGQTKPALGKRIKIDGLTGIITLDNPSEL